MSQTIRGVPLNFAASQFVQLALDAIIVGLNTMSPSPVLLVQTESAPEQTEAVEILSITIEQLLPEDGSVYEYIGTAARPAGQMLQPDGTIENVTGAMVYFFRRFPAPTNG